MRSIQSSTILIGSTPGRQHSGSAGRKGLHLEMCMSFDCVPGQTKSCAGVLYRQNSPHTMTCNMIWTVGLSLSDGSNVEQENKAKVLTPVISMQPMSANV